MFRFPKARKQHRVNWLLSWAGPRLAIEGSQVRLQRRRLFIVPTGAGFVFAALLLILLLVGMNYNNSMVFAFTFLLAGIGANAMWQTHRNLLGLCATLLPCRDVFAHRPSALRLYVDPSGTARRALELSLDNTASKSSPVLLTAVEPTLGALQLPGLPRGLQALPVVRIATRHPLGLFRAWSLLPYRVRVLVYPQPANNAPRLPVLPAAGGHFGTHSDAEDFDGLRPYRITDPPRRIAWRASARSQELLSKDLHAGGSPQVLLSWNELHGREVEERLSILCRWVLDAERLGLRYGLNLPKHRLEPSNGLAHRNECLRLLALHGDMT